MNPKLAINVLIEVAKKAPLTELEKLTLDLAIEEAKKIEFK